MIDHPPLRPSNISTTPAPHTSHLNHRPRFPHSLSSGKSPTRSTRFSGLATPFIGDPLEEEGSIYEPGSTILYGDQVSNKPSATYIDKGKMYDRAYQNSILVGSSHHANRSTPAMTFSSAPIGQLESLHEDEIDEPSSLDGDSFVAPTRERPFGADMGASGSVVTADVRKESEEARRRSGGVMGLLSEVYQDSRRWS